MLILWRCSHPRGDQTAFISRSLSQHLLGAELVMFPLLLLTKYSTHTHDHTLWVTVWKVHDGQGVMSCVCLSSCFSSLPVPLMKPHWGLWLPCTIRPAPVGLVCCCMFRPSLHKDSDCDLQSSNCVGFCSCLWYPRLTGNPPSLRCSWTRQP